jgi:hypothetical protein
MRDYEDLSIALRASMRPTYWLIGALLVAGIAAEYVTLSSGGSVVLGVAVALACGIAAAAVAVLSISRSKRTPAFETMYVASWLASSYWATNHLGRPPKTRAQAQRWLAMHSDSKASPCIRAGLLMWAGDYAGARRALADVHQTDPAERFDAVHLGQLLEFLEGRDPDIAIVREAAGALGDGRDRLDAVVSIADLEARQAHAIGGDPWQPLIAARSLLEPFPWRARAARAASVYAGMLVVVTGGAGLLAAWFWHAVGWIR